MIFIIVVFSIFTIFKCVKNINNSGQIVERVFARFFTTIRFDFCCHVKVLKRGQRNLKKLSHFHTTAC